MNSRSNRVIAGTLGAIIFCFCVWIYLTEFKSALYKAALHREVGEMLAEQAGKVLAPKGHVVLISFHPNDSKELKVQMQAFRRELNELGQYEIQVDEIETKDPSQYGVGRGLTGKEYLQTVKKNANADLFVSFIGAPKLSLEDIAELGNRPKLLVESKSGDNLRSLFEKKLIVAAVVARQSAGHKPDTLEEWFQTHYQILTAQNTQDLSGSE